ncbi:MAG: class I SAM-dependent methyltransferase [Solirubrobacteraceae bacterium]
MADHASRALTQSPKSADTLMDAGYELETHAAEDHHWWYRGRRRVLRQVLASLPLSPATRILDAGCGSGRNMLMLGEFGQVTGLEPAGASLSRARERAAGAVTAGTIEAMPFADGAFELAVCLDVIEHLDDDRAALTELRRVVAPGGRLVVTVPAYQWIWSSHDEVNHHRRRYTRRTLLAAASDAGWVCERSTHFNALLLPAAIAYRTLERVRRPSGPPVSDLHRTPGWLNRTLSQPLHFEAWLIRSGRRMPVGLSLLAVLR